MATAGDDNRASETEDQLSSVKVFVIEDDHQIRRSLEIALTDEGYVVEAMADGETALARLRTDPPSIALVDLTLPSMSGLELCRSIRVENDLPVMIVFGDVLVSCPAVPSRYGVGCVFDQYGGGSWRDVDGRRWSSSCPRPSGRRWSGGCGVILRLRR
jgi:hypothetical protein